VSLEDAQGTVYAQGIIPSVGPEWKKFSLELVAAETCLAGRLVIHVASAGVLDLDMVSLFPADTWNGMRRDLVEMLRGLRPGFIRFPGGCLVEGDSLENAYRWKDTIGPIEARRTNRNLWGYHQSYGIGFYEYFVLAEALGAEPVPVVNAGMSCQVRGAEICPLEAMDQWIQDALDLIEFANGPATSPWGAVRAALGHPEPFNLKYLGIGNENWGNEYYERFQLFQEAIKESHPQIQLIGCSGTQPDGLWWERAWEWGRTHDVDIVDEHMYRPPEWFLANTDRYDRYDRTGPKVMVGEFAAHPRNNLEAALAEAAFMTGLERNSDVVIMAAYAPLFNRADMSQWVPDLIWFNKTEAYGTPSYYVQQLFSRNRGDVVLATSLTDEEFRIGIGPYKQTYKVLYHVCSYDYETGDIILKVVNPWKTDQQVHIVIEGDVQLTGNGRGYLLTSGSPRDENSFEASQKVSPVELPLSNIDNSFQYTFPKWSVIILRIGTHGLSGNES